MATFVPMRKGDDEVTANIQIEGIVIWHFLYVADGRELAKDGTTSKATPFPLGLPDKLHMDVNTWHIALMNPTAASVPYKVSIAWTQGSKTIATWPKDGPEEGTLKTGESVVFDDSALLAIVSEAAIQEVVSAAETATAAAGAALQTVVGAAEAVKSDKSGKKKKKSEKKGHK